MSAFAAEYDVTVEVYQTPREWYNAHGGNVPPDFNIGYRLVQRHGSRGRFEWSLTDLRAAGARGERLLATA